MKIKNQQLKPVVFILALLPLANLVVNFGLDKLGVNPIEAVIRGTGDWALRFLLISLSISSLRRLFGWRRVTGLRRMIGLFTWFYASLHLLSYVWLDQFFEWREIFYDVLERPFITVGMLAWLLMTPLALTSNNASMRSLGRNWSRLHKLVYFIAILGVLHFWWMVKVDVREPFIYVIVLGILFAERIRNARCKTKPAAKKKSRPGPGLLVR